MAVPVSKIIWPLRLTMAPSTGRPRGQDALIGEGSAPDHRSEAGTSSIQVGMESKVPSIPKHAEVEADPGVLASFNSSVIEEFRANGGVVGGPFEDSAVMLLTMTGAKSGQRRLTPLEYFQVDGRVIFVGTRGGAETNPAWVHNVRANPNVHVEIRTESYDAVARELSDDERDSVYAKVIELCPRILTYPVPARQIPFFELQKR
jgi:deazaflavin-dependent oxidoreductase (nitroreductase family)